MGGKWNVPVLAKLARNSEPWRGCLLWTGWTSATGYGVVSVNGKRQRVHRVAFELFVGPIDAEMQIDHLCHNADPSCAGGAACRHRRCFEVAHLRQATGRENVLAAPTHPAARYAARTHCERGHELVEENVYVRSGNQFGRRCRLCERERSRMRARRRRAASARDETWRDTG